GRLASRRGYGGGAVARRLPARRAFSARTGAADERLKARGLAVALTPPPDSPLRTPGAAPRRVRRAARPPPFQVGGIVRPIFRVVFGCGSFSHEQPVPLFQQLARDNPSGGADVREVPAVAAQRRGFLGRARDRHQPGDGPVLL